MKEKPKHTFKAPKGYFESFNERLKARLDEDSEVDNSIIPKNDGFTVPEGYFDSLNPDTLKEVKNSSVKVVSLKSYRSFYYAAASIAAIFVLVLAWNWNQDSKMGFEDLANADIESYFENNTLGLTSYELAEVIDVEEINIADMTGDDLGDEEILEYLDENVDEIDDLNLEYDELD